MSPCSMCAAKCCRYFALEIDTPRSKNEFENLRWYLAHKGVSLYVQKRKWHLEIRNECQHLGKDNRCMIYNKRPEICKEHSNDTCEKIIDDFEHDFSFDRIEELDEYINKRFKKKTIKK